MSDTWRGHAMEKQDGRWVFLDTREPVETTGKSRPCGYCGKSNTIEGHDGCLGTLPGVMNACCGHGQMKAAYVQFKDGAVIRGQMAINYCKMHSGMLCT